MSPDDVILLRPRPYARLAGTFVLLPLLPQPKALKPLPSEIWTEILAFAFCDENADTTLWSWSFLTVCRSFAVSILLFVNLIVCSYPPSGHCLTFALFLRSHHEVTEPCQIPQEAARCSPEMGFYPPHPVLHPGTLGAEVGRLRIGVRRAGWSLAPGYIANAHIPFDAVPCFSLREPGVRSQPSRPILPVREGRRRQPSIYLWPQLRAAPESTARCRPFRAAFEAMLEPRGVGSGRARFRPNRYRF